MTDQGILPQVREFLLGALLYFIPDGQITDWKCAKPLLCYRLATNHLECSCVSPVRQLQYTITSSTRRFR